MPPDGTVVEDALTVGIVYYEDVSPIVLSVEPDTACDEGGTFVTVYGENFIHETGIQVAGQYLLNHIVSD